MTQYLPPNLLALFAPRDPIPYVPPLDVLPWEKKPWPYTGIAEYVQSFEDPGETPPATRAETKEERTARKQLERKDRHSAALKEQVNKWDVENDPNVDGDPFKTLFVGRINYDTSESKLRREFEQYGRIKRIHMVMNSETGKPRGYAFIEYEKERDMHAAYKQADGRKIDGKRVVVDVERGRTVKSWQPRRLGGGLGGTRRGGPNDNIKYSGRIDERDINDERRSRDGDRERKRSRSRDRERRRRSRSRDKGSQRERSRSRERRDSERRDRPRDRDRDRERSGRRDKDRERDRDRDKERSKDRHHRTDKDRSDRSGRKRERDSRDREERSDKKAKVDSRDSRSNGAEGTAEVKTES